MDKCNKCQQTSKEVSLYLCDKCRNYVCEDCYKMNPSYDNLHSEIFCPSCYKDLINYMHDEREYYHSIMKTYSYRR